MPASNPATGAVAKAQFQSFDDTVDLTTVAPRVAALRTELKRRDLAGFVVPRADRQQNEYVAPADERLAFLTSFTGSSGMAIVLADKAALFVDGRYTLQAGEQTDVGVFEIVPCRRHDAGSLDRGQPARQSQARLRSVAAHGGRREEIGQGLRRRGRGACSDRKQSDRRDLDRSPRSTARPCDLA